MFKYKHIGFLIVLLSLLCRFSYGQERNLDSLVANSYFDNEDYSRALKAYLELYAKNKKDLNVNYRIGYCYLQVNGDKSKAIPYFEYVYSQGNYKDDLLLHMGQAYTHAYNFEDALTFFNHYRRIIYSKRFELIENYYQDCLDGKIDYQKKITTGIFGTVDHYIENCESAIELFKNPVNVTFENLGPQVNSKYADYSPFITRDESRLYFTSRRTQLDSIPRWQNELPSDIYYSYVKDGQWTKAEKFGQTLNTAEDEACVYVQPDGKNMIVYQDNENASGDLFQVAIEDQPGKPESFTGPVNTQFREYEGCLIEEGNAFIFSSDREGGLGETDLYIVRKLPNGQWSVPFNLGPSINTKYKEAFPVFDEKSNTLYFASQGHINMGGYDIFSATLDTSDNTYGDAVNMGYPINTPEDDLQFSLSDNKREGYISAIRREGYGDYDIYKLVFNAVEKRPSVIRGVVSIKDKDTLRKEVAATISIKDAIANKELDSKKVNFQTGRYIFAVDNPGKYILTVKSNGFRDVQHEINLYDKSDYVFEIQNDFLLQKNENAEQVQKTDDSVKTEEVYSINKLPVNVIIWGIIKTDIPIESDINASIVVKDAVTGQDILKKNANPKSGKYTFSVSPGKYVISITSPGYKDYLEEINTEDISSFFQTGKNITLERIVTPGSNYSSPAANTEGTTAADKKAEVTTLETGTQEKVAMPSGTAAAGTVIADSIKKEDTSAAASTQESLTDSTQTAAEKKSSAKAKEKTPMEKKSAEKAAIQTAKKTGTPARKPTGTAKKPSTAAKKPAAKKTTSTKKSTAKKAPAKKPAKSKSSAKFN
ncbi:MAG: tetratricopeptide repeat protein [Bacteroidia bacterium]